MEIFGGQCWSDVVTKTQRDQFAILEISYPPPPPPTPLFNTPEIPVHNNNDNDDDGDEYDDNDCLI